MLGIGIDTGGTCTDSVVFDTDSKKILASAKSATTHNDLKIGIRKSLEKLPKELRIKADYVALSTTLATNACVEGKGARSGLVLIGAYEKLVKANCYQYGFPSFPKIVLIDGMPGEAMDIYTKDFENEVKRKLSEYESIAIAQRYVDKDGGAMEREVGKRITEITGIPCILSHTLTDEYDIMKRGSQALLNARLIPVMREFIDAVKKVLKDLEITGNMWIVRSDGTLMSTGYALEHPVETLLCGPAASVIAGTNMSPSPDALIVDIGGTTTDVSVVRDGYPLEAFDGVNVGSFKTLVKGVYIDTFGLGGDTRIITKHGKVLLDNRRVTPISSLAFDYPVVKETLKDILSNEEPKDFPHYEFFELLKEPDSFNRYNESEIKLINALKDGPLSHRELENKTGLSYDTLPIGRLEDEGIVLRAGITPTDMLHIEGKFEAFDKEAALLAAEWFAKAYKLSVEKLVDIVNKLVVEKLTKSLFKIVLDTDASVPKDLKKEDVINGLADLFYKNAIAEENSESSTLMLKINSVLVGVGAPTRHYIDKVAKLLKTTSFVPEYAATANAYGAAISKLSVSADMTLSNKIYEYELSGEGITAMKFDSTYKADSEESESLKEKVSIDNEEGDEEDNKAKALEIALDRAKEIITKIVTEKARKRGALGELDIEITVKEIKAKMGYNVDESEGTVIRHEIHARAIPKMA